jgi:hypothetical protein
MGAAGAADAQPITTSKVRRTGINNQVPGLDQLLISMMTSLPLGYVSL